MYDKINDMYNGAINPEFAERFALGVQKFLKETLPAWRAKGIEGMTEADWAGGGHYCDVCDSFRVTNYNRDLTLEEWETVQFLQAVAEKFDFVGVAPLPETREQWTIEWEDQNE